ncbi:MAG: DUF3422 domain-containing protein [Yoonia sp.]|jgi:uncharacterized membrane-anchored protein|nr:DUF3422 domain-containing protein [Yoonia sp.]MDG1520036.1 DUF3422 domain-containing protein [Yoonia sp.]
MPPIKDHPLRYPMSNELHARPFPTLNAPARAAYLALASDAPDKAAERAHLIALLDRYGAPHPQPDATHYSGQIGKNMLKWESHSEFVTYTIFGDGNAIPPFEASTFAMFPEDWLSNAPGTRITSALIRIEQSDGDDGIIDKTQDWFVPESLAISRVLEDELIIASDFRIDPAGHMRMAVFARPDTGGRRIGRVVQRLCEIETYKAMAMLGLATSRDMGRELSQLDTQLSALVSQLNSEELNSDETLGQLLRISAALENAVAQSAYRFGATRAYEAIVNQRIFILREDRFKGRQTFGEFMMRRFDPAMRTVESTQTRLQSLTNRAARASDLLRTRVDVERSAQNQDLLTSMDQRADLQLRLQQTVEGLSVVAITYYAVNLALYLLGPVEKIYGVSKVYLAAGVTPLVLLLVWWMVRRIRSKFH